MRRQEILRAVHAAFNKFQKMWENNMRDVGLGALVFVDEETVFTQGELACDYWTLADLRRYVRQVGENDEVVYQWLRAAETEGGFPVVVISPSAHPSGHNLVLSAMRKTMVA